MFPYQIKIDKVYYHKVPTMVLWCYNTLEHEYANDQSWTLSVAFGVSTFTFYNPKDVTMFKLKFNELIKD